MFGKKPEIASTDDVKKLMGLRTGSSTTQPAKSQVDSYNSKVVAQKEVDAFTATVQAYPKNVVEAAQALLGQVRGDSEKNGMPAPKGFFNQVFDGSTYTPEINTIAAYLFKNWHEQVMENGCKQIENLLDACVELKRYLDAQGKPVLNEFTGYFLHALTVNYIGYLTRNAPDSLDLVKNKLLSIESMCKKFLFIKDNVKAEPAAAAPQSQGNPLDHLFVSCLRNRGTSVEQVMDAMNEREAKHFYAQDKAVFLKLANYCYIALMNLHMAMKAGGEAEVDFNFAEALDILKTSPSYKDADAEQFVVAVFNVVYSAFLRWDTADLTAGQRLSLMQMGGEILTTIGRSVRRLVFGDKQATTDEDFKSSGLTWFDEARIEALDFLALKACANNLYNQDAGHGSVMYQKHLNQLGEIGKTPFGKAMFYAGAGIRVVVDNGGIESATAVLPAFKLIADWIAEQPDSDELFQYMNVPASIISGIEGKTPEFDAAFQDTISYLSSLYNKPKSPQDSMAKAFEAMEKLQQGLEQMPGIDQKDVARLRELLNKRNR